MAVLEGPTSGVLAEVGAAPSNGLHVSQRPLDYSGLGHYRVAVRFALANSQAANSRLFILRNTATNIILPTRLEIRWLQTAAHTAAILDSLDVYKLTGFTVTDTTNTVTPVPSVKQLGMGASPGNVDIRHVTVAGVAAGMTGGTSVKDSSPFARLSKWLQLAQPTAGPVDPSFLDAIDDHPHEWPFILEQNEGLLIENRVVLGVAAGSTVDVVLSYAELAATGF